MGEQPDAFDPLRDRLQAVLGSEYQVDRRLGAGGMGYVYLAREAPLKRSVAIKVLRPELATAVAAERFRQEAQLLASVNHPSVVTIHRVYPPDARSDGLPDAELFFFVMELVGGTLADRLKRDTMSATDVVRMGGQLLEGLALVHDRGIVHRDIKPSNIFFQEQGTAKLGDFGIAVLQDPAAPQLTGEGGSPLTVRYAAPEQIAGGKVDRRADLYSLALVCYEALTGGHKRVDQDPVDCDWTGVPRRLRRVLLRGLATDPADRWLDARAFARALVATQPGKWFRPAAVGGLVVAVMAVLLSLLPSLRRPPLNDLVLFPLTVEGAAGGGALAQAIGMLAEQDLGSAFGDSGLSVARLTSPPRGWGANGDSAWNLPASTWDSLRTRRVLRGEIRVLGDSMELVTDLVNKGGDVLPLPRIRTRARDFLGASWQLAAEVVKSLRDCVGECFKAPLLPPDEATVNAWRALGAAEDAFRRDNWTAAEAFYREALDLDPQLARARWGFFNVRRWERATNEADIRALAATYAEHASEFGELDRLLITADIAHTVPERLAKYDSAIRLFPYDVYPRLLRGNELFHRGALMGKGLDSAIAALELATTGKPYASTYSMLTWAYIRRGDSAGAARAFATYATLGPDQPFGEFQMGPVLNLARLMRFLPDSGNAMLQAFYHMPGGPESLALAVRMALAFEIPRTQLTIGQFLALLPDSTAQLQGLTAQSLALLALGRPAPALEKLEAASQRSGDPEYAFEVRQWRLALPALGVPGIAPDARGQARDAMRRAAQNGAFADRARWTLLLDALATDTGTAGMWLDRIGTATDSAATLHAIGTALLQAARGDTAGALALSDSLVLHTLVVDLVDPLHRAVLYLSRGRWLAGRDPAAADVAWRWYENADLVGWPAGPPQAAELDWAFQPFARSLRARLAIDRGDRANACAIASRIARYWENAETPLAELMTQLQTAARPCGPS